MESEALRNIRTMRQVKTSSDVMRRQKIKTTNSLTRTQDETERLQSLADRLVGQTLAKESKRFAALEESIGKSRGRLIKAREKLATTINKNRALTELRYELQRAHWEGKGPATLKKEQLTEGGNLRRMTMKY
jgi:predicted  nucleic acid-binding Zn-ribbon protein